MSLSLSELADRAAISDQLTAYATAVDSGRFDELSGVFTPDALVDYSATGGIAGTPAECVAWLGTVLPSFTAYCHFLGNTEFHLADGTATTRTLCLNPMQAGDSAFLLAIYYNDDWLRTDEGWRITRRVLETKLNQTLG
ncbi:nuclear transport factor 2 family protein [Gordonia crocea]|nr:nuclear transport factor 2 family protein [Gordonia crocea]